jgi:hypothetical protein
MVRYNGDLNATDGHFLLTGRIDVPRHSNTVVSATVSHVLLLQLVLLALCNQLV